MLQKFENSAIWESHKIEENTKFNIDIGVIISLLNDSIAASIKGYEDTPPLDHTIGHWHVQMSGTIKDQYFMVPKNHSYK